MATLEQKQDSTMRESLARCIKDGLDEVNMTRDVKIPTDTPDALLLYGEGGLFESMQLINFLMVVEEKIAEQLGITLSIVSEKAISRQVSPFSRVSTLVDYLEEEIGGAEV